MLVDVPAPADLATLRSIAEECAAVVDFQAEVDRAYGRVWLARAAPHAPPLAFLVAWIAGDALEVIDLCTAIHARRRGAARMLVTHALDHARQLALRAASLEVRRSNAHARALYADVGFTVVTSRPAYYADTGEDALILRLDLYRRPASATATARASTTKSA